MDASFWYVETEWEKSWEMDYIRSARQFIKNRFYTEYQICSVFDKEPYKLQQAVDLFMIQYRKNNLLEGRTALISNKERSVFVDDEEDEVLMIIDLIMHIMQLV